MDESIAQLVAMLLAALFWVLEMLMRRRQRRAQREAAKKGAASPDAVGGDSSAATAAAQVPPRDSSETAGAVSAAAGAKGGPKSRAKAAAGRIWRQRVRQERVREQQHRATDLFDGIAELSFRLRDLEKRGSPGVARATSHLRSRLEVLEEQARLDSSGPELERLSATLGTLARAAGTLELLLEARRGSNGRWLRVSDRFLEDVVDHLPGLAEGPGLALRHEDLARRSVLLDAGLAPVEMPEDWARDVTRWHWALEGALRGLFRTSPLGRQVFERVGLTDTWVVPYSEPAYLSSAQVVGVFGPWLVAMASDLLALILWGPAWARVVTGRLESRAVDAFEVRATPAGLHVDAEPPAFIRLWTLAVALEHLGMEGEAKQVRRVFDQWGEADHAFLSLPTRRQTRYSVDIKPFLQAGGALVEFLCDEPFAALDDRVLADLADASSWSRQAALARALARGLYPRKSDGSLVRLGAGLAAFAASEFDVRMAPGLAERALAGLEQDSPSRPAATGGCAASNEPVDGVTPDLVVESVMLGALLGRPHWASRPWRPGPWPVKPAQRMRRRRGAL